MNSNARAWDWIRGDRYPGYCLTFTRGRVPRTVLELYGADSDTARVLSEADTTDARPPRGAGSVLRTGTLGEWAFCFETHGVLGAGPEVLGRLSRGTQTLALLKGGDGMNVFEHRVDGRRAERFEPGLARTARGEGPHLFRPAVQQLIDAEPDPTPALHAALLVIGRHIGTDLDRDTAQGPLLTAYLDPGHRVPHTLDQAPQRSLGRNLGTIRPSNDSG